MARPRYVFRITKSIREASHITGTLYGGRRGAFWSGICGRGTVTAPPSGQQTLWSAQGAALNFTREAVLLAARGGLTVHVLAILPLGTAVSSPLGRNL